MRVIIDNYKKSINESDFSTKQIAVIWDFYVTKSVAKTAFQRRNISDYNRKQFPFNEMLEIAEINKDNCKVLAADSLPQTFAEMDLITQEGKKEEKHSVPIEISIPRIACITPYKIADNNSPQKDVGDAESVLTHLRNAFAHGNTYFFDNNYFMAEDKNTKTVTARIVLRQQTLLDWIYLIDSNEIFYNRAEIEEENLND